MTKYVAAKSNRNNGALVARDPTARSTGYSALMIDRTCRTMSPTSAKRPAASIAITTSIEVRFKGSR